MSRFTSLQITFSKSLSKQEGIATNIIIHTSKLSNCEAYHSSFFPSTIKLWNNLPIETTSSSNLNDFKTLIYLIIVHSYVAIYVCALYSILGRFAHY